MPLGDPLPIVLGANESACWHPDHFYVTYTGALTPQPWMQWRHVASVSADTSVGYYTPTLSSGGGTDVFGTLQSLFGSLLNNVLSLFGAASILAPFLPQAAVLSAAGNKNDLLQDIQTRWTNDSPIDQWVYGKITRGGARVTLQARSRGGLYLASGYAEGNSAGTLMESSMLGIGADLGSGGNLALGTTFCVAEVRMPSTTIPLAPERAKWHRLVPGATLTARVRLRFISEFWENTPVDKGNSGTESSYETGDTRLDLFAVPAID